MSQEDKIYNWKRNVNDPSDKTKGLDRNLKKIEITQLVIGIFVSILSIYIGFSTYRINLISMENSAQLGQLNQEHENNKFDFDRFRDIYDRVERYITSDSQNERQGRALVLLVDSIPKPELKSKLLALISSDADRGAVRELAASNYYDTKFKDYSELLSGPNDLITLLQSEIHANLQFDGSFLFETKTEVVFKDSRGTVWKVPAGYVFSSISVPDAFKSLINIDDDSSYWSSVALYRYYSDTKYGSSSQVNGMFYESLISSGMGEAKAKTLLATIDVFGPRWNSGTRTIRQPQSPSGAGAISQ